MIIDVFQWVYKDDDSFNFFNLSSTILIIDIMHQLKYLIFLILFNLIFGSYESPYQQRRYLKLSKQRVPENDNEYVWFTRDIHEAIPKGTEREIPLKQWRRILLRRSFNIS